MPEPVIHRPGDSESITNPVGGRITFALRGGQTDGQLLALETVAAPGEGPPLHTHANEGECLVVLEGAMRFRFGDQVEDAPAGTVVYVPRGAPHTWQNVGDAPARMLVLFTPAGMEAFFESFAAQGNVPGPEAFERAADGTGMDVVGPPLAQSHPR
ncbi:MAG TPA: cupin domain-containing protein [Gaiella sp.]